MDSMQQIIEMGFNEKVESSPLKLRFLLLSYSIMSILHFIINLQGYLNGKSVQEGNIATFFMYSEIQTMSSGKPTGTYIFLQNGLISWLKTLKGEAELAIVRTITASQGDGAAPARIVLTEEMESQRGKRVVAKARKGAGPADQGAGKEGGHAVGGRKGEAVVAAEAIAVLAVTVEAEVPLGPEVGAKRDRTAEEKIMKLPKQSENYSLPHD